jgi:hypothetical protein
MGSDYIEVHNIMANSKRKKERAVRVAESQSSSESSLRCPYKCVTRISIASSPKGNVVQSRRRENCKYESLDVKPSLALKVVRIPLCVPLQLKTLRWAVLY